MHLADEVRIVSPWSCNEMTLLSGLRFSRTRQVADRLDEILDFLSGYITLVGTRLGRAALSGDHVADHRQKGCNGTRSRHL